MQTIIRQIQILILGDGSSTNEQNNSKGHLLEQFFIHLLHIFGYENPKRENLNNTSAGIELDVTASHKLSRQPVLAECKAYSSPLQAKDLLAFYGKVTTERMEQPELFGFFVALPGLTAPAREQQKKIESHEKNFRVLSSDTIIAALQDRGEIPGIDSFSHALGTDLPLSDESLVLAQAGLFVAAKELDPITRLARRIVIAPCKTGSVPQRVIDLLGPTSFATGLPVYAASTIRPNISAQVSSGATDNVIVEVAGSEADFEYQLPASPKFFVGRSKIVSALSSLIDDTNKHNHKARLVVLNAQSGWGKSSLALRIASLAQNKNGLGVCVDCRTADSPTFIAAAVRHALIKAENAGILKLPSTASFGSVPSTLETLRRCIFRQPYRPLTIFFDQFENVFRSPVVTKEFRDLALGTTELCAPLMIGFAWKTDLVAFTEAHPYQLRDDIRTRAQIFHLEPFGASDIAKLISRLQKNCGQKIHRDLRERIQQYSQGLPWLFKKLASHILSEISQGASQEQLVSEALNIQSLFESDIKSLTLAERQGLRQIAKRVPIFATEAVEVAGGDSVVQTLLNQRLLVQVGDRLDVYWDIFRDYLNNGSVPVQDSYVLRLTPNTVSHLLDIIRKSPDGISPEQAAAALNSTYTSVLNMARDLRLLGVLALTESSFRLADNLVDAQDLNAAIRNKVAASLKRHKAYSLLITLASGTGRTSTANFAQTLPKEYPAVAAMPKTWNNYARAFAYWFQYAGLALIEKDFIMLDTAVPASASSDLLKPKTRRPKGLTIFPRAPFGLFVETLRAVAIGRTKSGFPKGSHHALADAMYLGLVTTAGVEEVRLTAKGEEFLGHEQKDFVQAVLGLLEKQADARLACSMISKNPAIVPLQLGRTIAQRNNLDWRDETAKGYGKRIRGWARAAGIKTALKG